jgi:hypothetical protein
MPREPANPEELQRLAAVFRELGADDPEAWARSQLEEGIPQLAIYCFTRALWEGVVDENDHDWIDRKIEWAKAHPRAPCAQVGPALQEMLAKGVIQEMLAKGVNPQAITDLARVMQYELLFHLCSLLDGSRSVDLPVNDWTLHQVDEQGEPVAIIQGLHEVLLSMDPTGREMRPSGST